MIQQTDTYLEGAIAHMRKKQVKRTSQKLEKDQKIMNIKLTLLDQCVLKVVVLYLKFSDIYILLQTCKKIGNFFEDYKYFWSERCFREFTSPLTLFKVNNLIGYYSQNKTTLPMSMAPETTNIESSLFSELRDQEFLENLGLKQNPNLFVEFQQQANLSNSNLANQFEPTQIQKMVSKLKTDNALSCKWYKQMLMNAKCLQKDWILSRISMHKQAHEEIFTPYEMLLMSKSIMNQLKSPNLPTPTLQRQNQYVNTKTLFQDILASFVFDEQDKYDQIESRLENGYNEYQAEMGPLGSHNFQFLQNLINNTQILETMKQQMTQSKEESQYLYDIRWFSRKHYLRPNLKRKFPFQMLGSRVSQANTMFTSSSSATHQDIIMDASFESNSLFKSRISDVQDDKQSQQIFEGASLQSYYNTSIFQEYHQSTHQQLDSGNPFQTLVLKLVYLVHKNISVHCQFVKVFLQNQEKGSDLMKQYIKRWDAFSAAAIQIHKDLFVVSALVNIIYEHIFPDHPCFPKFSLFRLCISIWRQQVFKPLQDSLINHTLHYIDRQRCKLKKYANLMKTEQKQQKICKNLQFIITRQQQKAIPSASSVGKPPVRSNSSKKHIKSFLNFQKKHLIYRIIQTLLDLSLNQLSIHYLTHININLTDTPYSRFQVLLSEGTKKAHALWVEKFHPSILLQIIEIDIKNLSQIITQQNLMELQQKSMKRFKRALQNRLKKKFEEFQRVKPQAQLFQISWTVDSKQGQIVRNAIGQNIDTGRVNKYIRFLHSDGGVVSNEISKFVKLQKVNQEKQEQIEYRCKKLQKINEKEIGIQLNLSEIELKLYSLCNETRPQYVKQITLNYKSTMLQVIENGWPSSSDESQNDGERSLETRTDSQLPSPPIYYIPPPMSQELNQDFSKILQTPQDTLPTLPILSLSQFIGPPIPSLPSAPKNIIQTQFQLKSKRKQKIMQTPFQSDFTFKKTKNQQKKQQHNYLAGFQEYEYLESMPNYSDINFALPLDQVEIKPKRESSKIPTSFRKSFEQPSLMFKVSSLYDEQSQQQDEQVLYL